MPILQTYATKGKKLSFANWISNLSPTETPFFSLLKKESTDQTKFSWQVDSIAKPVASSADVVKEGSAGSTAGTLPPTTEEHNHTQIFRTGVHITDTANKIGLYGRTSERSYQLEKASKELKRDIEATLLSNQAKKGGGKLVARETAGFAGMVSGAACLETGAKVSLESAEATGIKEADVFNLTYNMYLAGADVTHLMFHPSHMAIFSAMPFLGAGAASKRIHMFDGLSEEYNMYIKEVVDPLGQTLTLVPNRYMPVDTIYAFNPSDFSVVSFQEPETVQLAKTGSAEKWMIQTQLGLRLKNPYAAGMLVKKAADSVKTEVEVKETPSKKVRKGKSE